MTYSIPPEDDQKSIKEILYRHFGLSTRQISRLKFRPDGIQVDGKQVSVRYLVHTGQILTLGLEPEEKGSDQLIPTPGDLDIRYEDEDMVVINKPANLVVHPSHGHYTDSLANILVYHYGQQGLPITVRPVGRLDKDTSGLLIIAKHGAAAADFDRQRREGTLHRTYLALTEGVPSPRQGRITAPIGRNEDSLILRKVREDGDLAITDYEVLSAFSQGDYSLVRLVLQTGRTHQIRVHMAHLGHPLLGDPFYGTEFSRGMPRTALHSHEISCLHPFTHTPMILTCELPEDMKQYVDSK